MWNTHFNTFLTPPHFHTFLTHFHILYITTYHHHIHNFFNTTSLPPHFYTILTHFPPFSVHTHFDYHHIFTHFSHNLDHFHTIQIISTFFKKTQPPPHFSLPPHFYTILTAFPLGTENSTFSLPPHFYTIFRVFRSAPRIPHFEYHHISTQFRSFPHNLDHFHTIQIISTFFQKTQPPPHFSLPPHFYTILTAFPLGTENSTFSLPPHFYTIFSFPLRTEDPTF